MNARDQELRVEIIDGVLSISIGVDALMVAARGSDGWDDDEYEITSPDGFAHDIVAELLAEAEDGTTLVHVAFDGAIEHALEEGSLNIRYCGDEA